MAIHTVVGGQFGSEAKGHVAAQLANQYQGRKQKTLLVRVGGSNAGHSAVDSDGRVWALRQIPAAAVIDPMAKLVIAQGSEIDMNVLTDEINQLDAANFNVSARLYVDPSATIIEQHHIDAETGSDLNARTGSTAKGIGAARADRIMRKAKTARDIEALAPFMKNTAAMIASAHYDNGTVIVEGTQGYGLGMHTNNYPQSTSGDCRTVDLLQQIGFVPLDPFRSRAVHTWLVMRTFPIRVAGNSGGLNDELSWLQLNERSGGYIQPELTTVTKKVRRVGEWDAKLVQEAVFANGGNHDYLHPCLMFVDYLDPTLAGQTNIEVLFDGSHREAEAGVLDRAADVGQTFAMLGTSQSTVMLDHDLLNYNIYDWSDN
jgi:adenylosuccinate synthase